MKLSTTFLAAALVGGSLLTGCGDSGAKTAAEAGEKAAGGASDSETSAAVGALEAEITKLKELLENGASEEQITALEQALSDAESRLKEVETCEQRGDCSGYTDGIVALSPVVDAYCGWVFSCCTDEEARVVAASMGSEEQCRATIMDAWLRNETINLDGVDGAFDGEELEAFGLGLTLGRLVPNDDAIAACAAKFASFGCGDDWDNTCDYISEDKDPCEYVFQGTQQKDELCFDGDGPDQCASGFDCEYPDDTGTGTCVALAAAGALCFDDYDCSNGYQDSLACVSGTCIQMGTQVGDACAFFDESVGYETVLPCERDAGLFCGLDSDTCVSYCEGLSENQHCYGYDQCGDGLYCDFDADPTFKGICLPKKSGGQLSKNNGYAPECTSERASVGLCLAAPGEDCSSATCDRGSCLANDTCAISCLDSSECGAGQSCSEGVCYTKVALGGDCLMDGECPSGQYCGSAALCSDVLAEDLECERDAQCAPGSFCNGKLGCIPLGGRATGAACSESFHCESQRCDDAGLCVDSATLLQEGSACDMNALDLDLAVDPCATGTYCKRNAPETADTTGICTAHQAPGEQCSEGVAKQCEENAGCVESDQGGYDIGRTVRVCALPVAVPFPALSCVLEVPYSATSYANR